ncbi:MULTISPECIES: hypothetical protein [Spirulina sp. CCY15215]|nr:hypothetical protein [Spirulina major]
MILFLTDLRFAIIQHLSSITAPPKAVLRYRDRDGVSTHFSDE